jgi:hypothetical protein
MYVYSGTSIQDERYQFIVNMIRLRDGYTRIPYTVRKKIIFFFIYFVPINHAVNKNIVMNSCTNGNSLKTLRHDL